MTKPIPPTFPDPPTNVVNNPKPDDILKRIDEYIVRRYHDIMGVNHKPIGIRAAFAGRGVSPELTGFLRALGYVAVTGALNALIAQIPGMTHGDQAILVPLEIGVFRTLEGVAQKYLDDSSE